ncbi:hypothetical protein [Sphingomonas hankyongi]|uniref:Uncharacterized protein n=1 Tax=Sphingomonas hankyongi TaxID=2908209 RepID=A0ABT0RZC2_9SPHN|nr:hypothetical protein [Sphingomonas hankyongi]MCL6728958.1 hypothetical protein [Sphingomonas hankyongi]
MPSEQLIAIGNSHFHGGDRFAGNHIGGYTDGAPDRIPGSVFERGIVVLLRAIEIRVDHANVEVRHHTVH